MSTELVDQIRLGWVVLGEADAPVGGGITTHPVIEIGDESLLLGLDGAGVPYLLIPAPGRGPEEDVGMVTVRNRELVTGAGPRPFVVVSCLEVSLRDVFDHFLAGVIAAVEADSGQHPGAVAVKVLARWNALFRTTGAALGPSDLAALLAELLVLEMVVERDPGRSVAVWTGPEEARHDLRRGSTAVEVKSTLSHTARQVTIHGIDQLEPPGDGSLTLAWHRFDLVPEGPLSVYTVADRLVAAGVSAVELYDRMDAAGSPLSLREQHDGVRFSLREQRFFAVAGDFPRLVTASFPAGVPDGVDDITYKVVLPADDAVLGVAARDHVLDRMAGIA